MTPRPRATKSSVSENPVPRPSHATTSVDHPSPHSPPETQVNSAGVRCGWVSFEVSRGATPSPFLGPLGGRYKSAPPGGNGGLWRVSSGRRWRREPFRWRFPSHSLCRLILLSLSVGDLRGTEASPSAGAPSRSLRAGRLHRRLGLRGPIYWVESTFGCPLVPELPC